MFRSKYSKAALGVVCYVAAVSPGWGQDHTVSVGFSQRIDSLDWSIGIEGTGPNVLSELTWRNVKAHQLDMRYEYVMDNWLYARADIGLGQITDGKVQDSDYFDDNRTIEFSRSISDADKGNFRDYSAAVGIPFVVLQKRLAPKMRITPEFGISKHIQELRMRNGNQVYPAYGPFPGLNSTYEAEWTGYWWGVDFFIDSGPDLTINIGLQMHTKSYEAEANWNLRETFAHPKSFAHKADHASGTTMIVGYTYRISKRWRYSLQMENYDWQTDAGTDTVYFADGTTVSTRLNQVNWHSRRLQLMGKYLF